MIANREENRKRHIAELVTRGVRVWVTVVETVVESVIEFDRLAQFGATLNGYSSFEVHMRCCIIPS